MDGVKGTCGICGGRVIGYLGVWMGTTPPPPGVCEDCGAVEAAHGHVLQMVPRAPARRAQGYITGGTTIDCGCINGCQAWDCRRL